MIVCVWGGSAMCMELHALNGAFTEEGGNADFIIIRSRLQVQFNYLNTCK